MTMRQMIETRQSQVLRQRVQMLYRQSGDAVQRDRVLSRAFDELDVALEALQLAELRLQSIEDERRDERAALEQAAGQWKALFTDAPAAYLITSLDGTVRQANVAATSLLQTDERALIGRSLMLFVPNGQRRSVRATIAGLTSTTGVQRFAQLMQLTNGSQINVDLHVVVARGRSGQAQGLWWILTTAGADVNRSRDGAVTEDVRNHARTDDHSSSCDSSAPARQFAALAEISVLLTTTHDEASMLSQVAQLLVPAVADGCAIDLVGTDGAKRQQVVTLAEQSSDEPAQRPSGTSSLPPRAFSHPQSAALRTVLQVPAPHAEVITPIEIDGQEIGSITLLAATAARDCGPVEVALAQELARRIGAALARMRAR